MIQTTIFMDCHYTHNQIFLMVIPGIIGGIIGGTKKNFQKEYI